MSNDNGTSGARAARARLALLVDPLRDELARLDQQITDASEVLAELRATRLAVKTTLDRLDPSPAPKPKTPEPNEEVEEKAWSTLRYLRQTYSSEDVFTRNAVAAGIKNAADAGGQYERVSIGSLDSIFNELRDAGLIRKDRKVKGGGDGWKLVAS